MAIKYRSELEAGNTEQQEQIITELLNLDPGQYRVYIMDAKPNRRPQANAYYWKVILGIISHHTGHDKYALHEMYKTMFNPKVVLGQDLSLKLEGESTTDLNTKEFWDFTEAVIIHASVEHGLTFPPPKLLPDEILIELDTKNNTKIWK